MENGFKTNERGQIVEVTFQGFTGTLSQVCKRFDVDQFKVRRKLGRLRKNKKTMSREEMVQIAMDEESTYQAYLNRLKQFHTPYEENARPHMRLQESKA